MKREESTKIIGVKEEIEIPLLLGVLTRGEMQLKKAYNSGEDLVVIGSAFEDNESYFEELKTI